MNISPTQVSNHETWLAGSWLFADEDQFNRWIDLAAQLVKLSSPSSLGNPIDVFMGEQMQSYYCAMIDREVNGPGVVYDLVNHSLQKVMWTEIAQLVIDHYTEH